MKEFLIVQFLIKQTDSHHLCLMLIGSQKEVFIKVNASIIHCHIVHKILNFAKS